jgi:hypothetical protein
MGSAGTVKNEFLANESPDLVYRTFAIATGGVEVAVPVKPPCTKRRRMTEKPVKH